jgi:glycerol-3-phosphate acyltransferase PlsY
VGGRMNYVLLALLSYFIGSFPTAYLLDKKIFRKGSGNMGAFNFWKTNKSNLLTSLVLLIDVLKGVIIVIISQSLTPGYLGISVGVIAGIIGHDYSIFIKFRGGKGMALACGAILLLEPLFLLIIAVVSGSLYLVLKDNVKAGLISLPILLVIVFVMRLSTDFIIMGVISAVLIAHKDVIKIVARNPKLFR